MFIKSYHLKDEDNDMLILTYRLKLIHKYYYYKLTIRKLNIILTFNLTYLAFNLTYKNYNNNFQTVT